MVLFCQFSVVLMPQTNFSHSEVWVAGSRGNVYCVEIMGDIPFSCTCPDYVYRAGPAGKLCKHMLARVGKQSIGTTRCVICTRYLTIEDIASPVVNDQDLVMCAGCVEESVVV
jgi:predicted nucleic acid-binding Zn finger protein